MVVVGSQNVLSSGRARSLLTREGAFLWIQNDPLVSSTSEVAGWRTHLSHSCRRM